ncbi:MAG: carbohydrate kinase, partial [Gemmatimonadetes bacterium]
NFACHAAALGADSWMASAVGVDELGRSALDTLKSAGVQCETVARDGEHETGQVLVTLDSSGQPSYRFADDSAWDHLEWSASLESLAERCDAVCFGTLGQRSPTSRATIQRFVSATPQRALRMFDVNLRQRFFDRETIHTSLQIASAVKVNEEELPTVAELCQIAAATPGQLLRKLVERYELRLAALTCGAEGALLIAGDEQSVCPAVPAKVVDTVGAGDAFTATLVVDFLRGLALGEVNRHANAVASFVCSQPGAVMRLPDYLVQPA